MSDLTTIPSGFPGLDKKLDYIRPGDNLVFRVKNLEFFRFFANAFVDQAKTDGHQIHYIRFGSHKPMIPEDEHIVIHKLDPSVEFESFTVAVYQIIRSAGEGAYFIFDNISYLEEFWNTDLMIGNFMRVTCPFLTEMKDVTYFPLRRGAHSYDSMYDIRESAQIFMDVYYKEPYYYLTPLKVENRYHGEMFLTHRIDPDNSFHPMTYSTSLSRYYAAVDEAGPGEQLSDSWDEFFTFMQLNYANKEVSPEDKQKMCSMLMTREPQMQKLILENFKTRDYLQIHNRMVGTGRIGGKACGMLLARKLVLKNCPKVADHFEPHDSYYIGSDIYYTYIIHNKCWPLWLQQRADPENREIADAMLQKLLNGRFPANVRHQIRRLLDYFGTSPIIIRSSSFLEDGFGNAFAGKYESVFCINGGTLEHRQKQFEQAIRIVYASTMSPSALEYRKIRGLLDKDEQMALLVQRVSGSHLGDYHFPMAAGVGYSYNSYPWSDEIDPNAGMLRLVAGLGTRAVDRTPGDYPRLVSLDKPKLTPHSSTRDRHKFSQHRMDVLDTVKNELLSPTVEEVYPLIMYWQQRQIYSHDWDAERMFRDRGQHRTILFADCETLISNKEFISCMQDMLKSLQREYGTPVDIEYTINTAEDGDFQINLLQCRPLQAGDHSRIELPEIAEEDTYFHICKNVLGNSRHKAVDYVVVVDPYKYYTFLHARKPDVARAVGQINRYFEDQDLTMLLITPGRIGTSSPELGVPVSYAEISHFDAIMEVAYSKAGYMPELSFGSHMFQDLVEANILYIACMENGDTLSYHPEMLSAYEDVSSEIIDEEMAGIISVYKTTGSGLSLAFDNMKREIICGVEK